MVNANSPIGVFDSGLGGLTVARALIDLLPRESLVYFGDTGRFPYGPRPLEEVHKYACQIIDFLVEQGVKLIVVGCNSASAALWSLGRPNVSVPIIGVIEPPAQTAARLTRSRRVGVIGTQATIDSRQYEDAIARTRRPIDVYSAACPQFVALAESGKTVGREVFAIADDYLAPLKEQQVDTLILGCTHYPLLEGAIQYVMGPDVLLVSSAEETAKDVYTVLVASGLLRNDDATPEHEFMTSGDEDEFALLGKRFLGPEILAVKKHPF